MSHATERLIDRPLTDQQRFALRAVACGDLKIRERLGHGSTFLEITTNEGLAVGGQITALRRRKFVRWGAEGLTLTVAGAFELFFDGYALCENLIHVTVWNDRDEVVTLAQDRAPQFGPFV